MVIYQHHSVFIRTLVIWAVGMLLMGGQPGTTQADTIHIRADEWFPMNGEPGAEKPGYMIELIQTILQNDGHVVDYQLLPWDKALAETRAGYHHCVVGALKEEAPDFLYPSYHWGLDSASFFVSAEDDWRFLGDFHDLNDRKVGLILDYYYGDGFDEYAEANAGSQFKFVSGKRPLEQIIRLLMDNRLDTLIENESVLNAQLMEMNLQGKLVTAGRLPSRDPLYIACSPNHKMSPYIIERVNQTMPELYKSGYLDKLMQRYGLGRWAQ